MRARFAPILLVLTLAAGGCSSGGTADPTTPSALGVSGSASPGNSNAVTSGTSSGSPTTPGSAPSGVDVGPARARVANDRLTTSLYALVQSLKKAQADNRLSEVRRTLGTATTAGRAAVKRQRSAAYPSSTRNCTTVRVAEGQLGTAVTQGGTARKAIGAQVVLLKADLTSIGTVTASVTSHRDALAAALKGLSQPPATVPTQEVTAALKEAADRRAEIASALTSVTAADTEAGQTFDKLVAQARTISSDACT